VILNIVLVLVQGWSSFSPSFQVVDFISFYIELPIMLIMFLAWKLIKRTHFVHLDEMDLVSDRFDGGFTSAERAEALEIARQGRSPFAKGQGGRGGWKERMVALGTWLFF
jgi:AAT family amino acid transporter